MTDYLFKPVAKGPWLRPLLSSFGPLLGLVGAWVLFAVLRFEVFATAYNSSIILQQTAVIGIAALGMTLVIIAGGIDLSVASIIALVTVVIAKALGAGWSPWLAITVGLVLGSACGALSGVLITQLRLLPFVVTLGMMGSLRGTAKLVSNEQPIYPDETWINGLMRLGPDGGLPPGVWLMGVLAVLVGLMLKYTRFGRHIFALGSNELTAQLCGVPVARVKILVYALGAALASVAAVLQYGYISCGDPTTAGGLELNIIAAVVIGGASLSGGQGTIQGTLVGALIMSVVANGCTKVGLNNSVQEIVTGVIIIVAVLLDYLRRAATRS